LKERKGRKGDERRGEGEVGNCNEKKRQQKGRTGKKGGNSNSSQQWL